MAMLPRLKPRKFYDLVVQVSIVRPGPITGGMVHPYLRRRAGEEPVEYPHECLEPVLEKTLGVPLFQEQVMRLAVVAADYTPGEADQLRRDMAAWRKTGRLERHRERLVSRMIRKGIEEAFAERVFEQIRGFGEYGFPESHAASFALISYATSYIRCHYLPEFTCSLLNSQPMGFYSPSTIVHDAQRHGLEVRPVDVLHSRWDCTLEPCLPEPGGRRGGHRDNGHRRASEEPLALRMGLRYVKGLREDEGRRVSGMVEEAQERGWGPGAGVEGESSGDSAASRPRVEGPRPEGLEVERPRPEGPRAERPQSDGPRPPFRTVEEFTRRAMLPERSLRLLAEAGALDSLTGNRRQALWRVQGLSRDEAEEVESGSSVLELDDETPDFGDLDEIETLAWDYRTTSHSPRAHLLEPFRDNLEAHGPPDAATVTRMPDGRRVDYAGIVICRQRPGTASGVVFMTLEDETGFVNAIFWPKVFQQYRTLARALSFLGVSGKVQAAEGVVHVVVDRVWDPRGHARPPETRSRDFH